MRKKKVITKVMAMLLSFAVVFSMMPGVVFADTGASSKVTGTIIVHNAAELAALGGQDIEGTVELAGDIDMGNVPREPIKSLTGTFEGNGYTISNLNISSDGSNGGYLGLIAKLSGDVQDLQIKTMTISATSKSKVCAGAIAGIINSSSANIKNCNVDVTINKELDNINNCIGGIVGSTDSNSDYVVTINNVFSSVNIENTGYIGGLIGCAQYIKEVHISNSAVIGSITKKGYSGGSGGIIGWLGNTSPVVAENVYFGGNITGSGTCGFAYNKTTNSASAIRAEKVYYNKGSSSWSSLEALSKSYGYLTGTIEGKSTDELKGLTLTGFAKSEAFGEYPVPAWLTKLADKEHTVTVKAADAGSVTLTKDNKDTNMDVSSGGVFTAVISDGIYTYTAVPKEGVAKDTATGTLIVGKTDKEMTITLPYKVPDTVITLEPANADLKVYKGTDANGELIYAESADNGSYTYALKEGDYYYKAEAEDYETAAGTFKVPVENSSISVKLTALPKYEVTFDVTCGDKTPEIRVFKGEKNYTPGEDGKYSLTAGTYSYEVTAEDHITKTGTFEITDNGQTVTVKLDTLKGTGTAEEPYVIGSRDELAYFAQQVNKGVKKYAESYVKLSDDIDLGGTSWAPIGSNRTMPFKGHFDGQGHTVSGLNVDNARTYYGFFGCLDNATVENLILKGQVYCSEPYARAGGLAGYAVGDVTIKNCGSAVNVSALARGCEGVGGLVGGYEDGIEYKWEDHKMLIKESYNAGNIVCTGSDSNTTIGGLVGGNKNCVQLEDCYNAGTVYGPGVQAAGLLGNAGAQTGDNCKPSMKGCYNSGKVVGADGKAFGLYAKGTIAAANIKDCYVEAGTAAGANNGETVVSDKDARKEMLKKLGANWTVDDDGNPYLKNTEAIAPDTSLVDELSKYLDTVSVSANTEIKAELKVLKDGNTATDGITAEFTQSADDIHSGYITASGNSLKLNKKNETGAAVTETATLKLSKDGITLSKPISIVIYPAGEKITALIDTIAKSYVNKYDEWVVFDMAAYAGLTGKTYRTSDEAKQNYLNLTINALEQNSATASDRAKGEIILSALNIDSTKLKTYGGTEYNNAAKLKAMAGNAAYYTAPWILLADEQGNVNLTAAQVQQLVKTLTDSQGSNGICQGSYWGKKYDDIDTTGTALAALARFARASEDTYGVKSAAADFIKNAVSGLEKAQGENGSFGNVNTDAMVITGLAAIGTNPNNFSKNGSSLADALTLYINDSHNGFTTGYSDGTAGEKAQALATEQGFRALIVLEKIKNSENGNSYNIYTGKNYTGTEQPSPEPKPESGKNPGSATGEGKTEETPETPNPGEPGSKNIVASLTVSPDGSNEWITAAGYTLAEGSTAYDLITKALAASGMSCIGADKNYITAVSKGSITLANFDKGPNSGWLYSVNGVLPNVGIQDYILKNGDSVKLYYVEDWTKDSQAGAWTGTNNEVITTGNTGSAITTVPTEVKISGNTATATVTEENAAELIKQAKENKSAEIVINVLSSDTNDAETVNLELDKKTVESIVKDTEATVTVKTPAGEINLDKETLKQIAGEASGNKISIEITKVSKPEEAQKSLVGANGQIFKLAAKSGNKMISKFKGTVTVRLAVPAALKDKNIAAVHIKDGALEKLEGRRITQNKVEFYEFKTPHFSEFALVDTADVKLDSDDKNDSADKAKSLIKELKLKAVSSKTAKKNVKVTVKMNSKNNTLIKELSDMGYTVKYRYYRSVKKASKYTAVKTKTSKTYINTKGKRGSKYYYKVRAVVYDGDKVIAQSALKQCKYAVRTWTK